MRGRARVGEGAAARQGCQPGSGASTLPMIVFLIDAEGGAGGGGKRLEWWYWGRAERRGRGVKPSTTSHARECYREWVGAWRLRTNVHTPRAVWRCGEFDTGMWGGMGEGRGAGQPPTVTDALGMTIPECVRVPSSAERGRGLGVRGRLTAGGIEPLASRLVLRMCVGCMGELWVICASEGSVANARCS
jgi:hypothetical protein